MEPNSAQPCSLVAFDTDRIKEYLFSTPDLRRLRGASLLLDALNRGTRTRLDEGFGSAAIPDSMATILARYAELGQEPVTAGGMGMALLRDGAVPGEVIAQVERLYRQETGIASVTGVPLQSSRPAIEGKFERVVKETALKLRRAKDEKQHDFGVPLASFLHPCDACRRYPAQFLDQVDERLVCRACHVKGQFGSSGRSLFLDEFRRSHAGWQAAKFPADFNEIGEAANPSGYIGLIYADGNGIGSVLERMPSFDKFRRFSTGLDELVRGSVYGALASVVQPPGGGVLPFEFVLMGGDDLMLVIKADAALRVAMELTRRFGEGGKAITAELGLNLERPLGLSTAVVIAKASFPIRVMYGLASELLLKAKRKSANAADGGGVGVDFMVVTEAGTLGVEALRSSTPARELMAKPDRGERVALTSRPYTLDRMQTLLECVGRLKTRISRHHIRALYEDIFYSRIQAQLTGLMVRRKGEDRAVWDAVAKDLGIDVEFFPWRRSVEEGNIVWSTPIGDLVEIYDFVGGDIA